jgi:hypothetical protein
MSRTRVIERCKRQKMHRSFVGGPFAQRRASLPPDEILPAGTSGCSWAATSSLLVSCGQATPAGCPSLITRSGATMRSRASARCRVSSPQLCGGEPSLLCLAQSGRAHDAGSHANAQSSGVVDVRTSQLDHGDGAVAGPLPLPVPLTVPPQRTYPPSTTPNWQQDWARLALFPRGLSRSLSRPIAPSSRTRLTIPLRDQCRVFALV